MTNEEMVYYLEHADVTVGQKCKTKTAEAIEKALKIIATQPKRGKWIFNENMHDYCCSECGCLMPNVNEYYRKKIIGCPYCLADMREVKADADSD